MKRPMLPAAAGLAGQGDVHGSEPLPAEPWPEGFAYREEVISADEERVLAMDVLFSTRGPRLRHRP